MPVDNPDLRAVPATRENLADALTWAPGETCFDDLRVVRALGAGGTAGVHEAFSPSLNARFVVKRVARQPGGAAELERLLDLPDHPHLARCRLFRRLGENDWALCFEWVEGTDLAGWLAAGPQHSPAEAIDLAIQSGWAVGAIHELGWVHLDVKPANLLRAADGRVVLLDFGSCLQAGPAGPAAPPAPVLTTAGYRSPWHPPAGPIGPRADLWSWGLTALELFAGRAVCAHGVAAPAALARYLREPAGGIPVSGPVAEILGRCFVRGKGGWESITEACRALVAEYTRLAGSEYSRQPPQVAKRADASGLRPFQYRPPALWLNDIRHWLASTGLTAGRAEEHLRRAAECLAGDAARTPRATAVRDSLAFEELDRAYERLPVRPADWAERVADFRLHRAAALVAAGDVPGAQAVYAATLAMSPGDTPEWANLLADTHEAMAANLTASLDGFPGMIDQCHQAAGLGPERQVGADSATTAAGHARRAVSLLGAGKRTEAKLELWKAIAFYRKSLETDGSVVGVCYLASTHKFLSDIHEADGERQESEAHHDVCTFLYESVVGTDLDSGVAPLLADCWVQRSRRVRSSPDRSAPPFDDRALAVYQRHIVSIGQNEWRPNLASGCREKARRLRLDGEHAAARDWLGQADDQYRILVEVEGRARYRFEWASSQIQAAEVWADLGDHSRAIGLLTTAIETLTWLMQSAGQTDCRPTLAHGLALRARCWAAKATAATDARAVADSVASRAYLGTAAAKAGQRREPAASTHADTERILADLPRRLDPEGGAR